jgi:hypothetical protein
MEKRIYFGCYLNEGEGYAVVAESATQAKELLQGELDCEWVDVRVRICRDNNQKPIVPPDNLKFGHLLSAMEGLKLGAYGWFDYEECPVCKQETTLRKQDDDSIMCDDCWDAKEELEQNVKQTEVTPNSSQG